MYKLIELATNIGEKNIEKTIDTEFAEKLLCDINLLGIHMRSYFFYQMTKRNLKELTDFIEKSQNILESADTIECNRLLYNFENTFYSFINYFEKKYREVFADIKKTIYENYFEYRFVYYLRNYMTHENLAVLKQTSQFFENRIERRFIVSKKDLINSVSCKKEFKKELEQFSDEDDIDLYLIISKLKEIIGETQLRMLKALLPQLKSCFNNLMQNIPNKQEVFILRDEKIINGLLNVANKYYTCFSEYFCCDDYLFNNIEMLKTFKDFSFAYYKEKNAYYIPPNNKNLSV